MVLLACFLCFFCRPVLHCFVSIPETMLGEWTYLVYQRRSTAVEKVFRLLYRIVWVTVFQYIPDARSRNRICVTEIQGKSILVRVSVKFWVIESSSWICDNPEPEISLIRVSADSKCRKSAEAVLDLKGIWVDGDMTMYLSHNNSRAG